MIVVRNVFQAKFGKINELVEKFKNVVQQGTGQPGMPGKARILTDLSGPFFNLILESEFENLAAYDEWRGRFFSSPEFRESAARTSDLVESGRAEFYTLEAELGG